MQAGLPDLHVYFDQMLLPFSNSTDSPIPEDPGPWVLSVFLEAFGCPEVSLPVEIPVAWIYPSELVWLKRHTRSLLWLNPLLRFEGYAPIATGASVLNRHVNGMLAIHNLSRLEELASALNKLLKIK